MSTFSIFREEPFFDRFLCIVTPQALMAPVADTLITDLEDAVEEARSFESGEDGTVEYRWTKYCSRVGCTFRGRFVQGVTGDPMDLESGSGREGHPVSYSMSSGCNLPKELIDAVPKLGPFQTRRKLLERQA